MSDLEAAQAALVRAWHYLGIDQPDRALKEITQHAGALANDGDAWMVRVAALLDLGNPLEASRAARAGLSVAPDSPRLLGLAALAHQRQRELAQAERLLLRALSLRPEDTWLITLYAELVALAGQYDKAEALLARAAAIDPEAGSLLRARYNVANLRGDDRETRRLAQQMAAERPDDPDALALLGIERLHANDLAGARRVLGSAASLDVRTVEEAPGAYDSLRLRTHWLLWPLRLTDRVGQVWTWLIAVGVFMGGNELSKQLGRPPALEGALVLLGLTWIAFCIYSWVAPPLLSRHLARRRRLR